jgi:ABC-type amino acid transport substrate-binding protein
VLATHVAAGQEPELEMLRVGTRDVPPFSMQRADGEWEGVAIELWREIAAATDHTSTFRAMELEELLDGVANGDIDVGVAAITVTAEREARLDFTHPYYSSGLGIAVVPERGGILVGLLRRVVSWEFVSALSALAVVLLGAGILVWFFERRRNAEQFGGPAPKGLASGFWWAAVTMTTVGYGDKAPQTFGGRVVALVWMFASIIIISSFTAAIATALTVGQLSAAISGPEDLPGKRVGTVGGSTSEDYLFARGISPRPFDTIETALDALAAGSLDAVVYDAPVMQYHARRNMDGRVSVLPGVFERQDYALVLPQGSPLREDFNRIILEKTEGDWWQSVLSKYLGATAQ